MQSCNFSFPELVASVQKIESIEAKIEFISERLMDCNQYLLNMRHVVNSIKIAEVEIRTDHPKVESALNDLLKNDETLRNQIVREKACILNEKLCENVVIFREESKMLLEHHQRIFENKHKSNGLIKGVVNPEPIAPEVQRLVWKSNENMLLKLFLELNRNEFVAPHIKDDILPHFANEKLEAFSNKKSKIDRFVWLDSDSNFAVFVYVLSNYGLIEDMNKFKNFSEHFVNSRGKTFQYLSQKRNYSDNLSKSVSVIKEILTFLKNKT